MSLLRKILIQESEILINSKVYALLKNVIREFLPLNDRFEQFYFSPEQSTL